MNAPLKFRIVFGKWAATAAQGAMQSCRIISLGHRSGKSNFKKLEFHSAFAPGCLPACLAACFCLSLALSSHRGSQRTQARFNLSLSPCRPPLCLSLSLSHTLLVSQSVETARRRYRLSIPSFFVPSASSFQSRLHHLDKLRLRIHSIASSNAHTLFQHSHLTDTL